MISLVLFVLTACYEKYATSQQEPSKKERKKKETEQNPSNLMTEKERFASVVEILKAIKLQLIELDNVFGKIYD